MQQRVALVSGCSSGIGLALAHRLVAEGWHVHAGVRRREDAARLPRGAVPVILDVTRAEQIAEAVGALESAGEPLGMLVNNAGVNAPGPWETVPEEMLRRVFEVNFFGAVALTRAVLPLMRRQASGRIVMISSLSGLVGLPGDGIYAASKFALEAFAESLSFEVARWNIKVDVISPGGYATELGRKALQAPAGAAGPYAPLIRHIAGKGGRGDPDAAAAAIVEALRSPTGDLRHPIDETARRVFAILGYDDQQRRRDLIRNASGLAWWSDGQPHG